MLGFGDKATELYRMINPIDPADVYGAGNLAGRGGWTWYTGSSSWFYTAGIEYILGIKIKENSLSFNPCIPKTWKEFSCRYKYGESIYNIKVVNPNNKNMGITSVVINGEKIENTISLDGTGKIFNVEVKM